MKSSSKMAITAVAIIVALPAIVLLAAEVILNSTGVKSEIERMVAETLEMEFKIEGRIDVRLLPFLALSAKNLTVEIKSGQITSADQIVIDPRLRPLLNLDIEIEKAHLQRPRLTFNPHAIEKIIALIDAESDGPLPVESLTIESFSITEAGFAYAEDKTLVDVEGINFRGGRIDIIANRQVVIDDVVGFFKALNFSGEMEAGRIFSRYLKLENLKAKIRNENGLLTADPVYFQLLGSDTRLRATLDLIQPDATFKSTLDVAGLDMKAMAKTYFPAVNISSMVDVTTGITASGIQLEQLVDYVSGSGPDAGRTKIPIKSVMVEAFTVATRDLAYSNDTITIDQAELNFKGDQWALIRNNSGTLMDFDSFLKATKISGPATIKSLTLPNHQFKNLQGNISNDHGILTSDPIELEYFGEQARIGIIWNLKDTIEHIQLRLKMDDLDIENLLKRSSDQNILHGKLSVQGEFEYRGTDIRQIVRNLNGNLIIQGTGLKLDDVDFDKALDEFQKMGAYGFSDFAALITLGPLGPVVSSGYDQIEALEKMMAAKGDSTIQHIKSDWKIINGVAHTSDVAFSTQRHRVAIVGSIDFANQRFQEVTIAVVDPNGCIINKEIVDGSFEKPEVKETGVVQRTVIRPLKRFLKSDCESFYAGSVPHPTATTK